MSRYKFKKDLPPFAKAGDEVKVIYQTEFTSPTREIVMPNGRFFLKDEDFDEWIESIYEKFSIDKDRPLSDYNYMIVCNDVGDIADIMYGEFEPRHNDRIFDSSGELRIIATDGQKSTTDKLRMFKEAEQARIKNNHPLQLDLKANKG